MTIGLCVLGLASGGCAVRAARSETPAVQSANPRYGAGADAAPTSTTGRDDRPQSPRIMIVEPDGLSVAERRDVDLWTADASSRAEQLSAALSAGGGPNCSAAREHLRAMCELAERICGISARHPSDDDLESRCEESRERCRERTEEVTARCGGS
ncbi:MAG: hypothetical protein IT293_18890 [Deltaproteobacteria bacterium]|nr:hypothetical protein [Deltaproteobacteria bacterium]